MAGAAILNGSIDATTFSLDDAMIGANLTGGSLTASDLVSLSGTDSISTVTVNSGGELDVDGSLTSSGGVTNYGTLDINGLGTLSGNVWTYGALAFNISNSQVFAGNIIGWGTFSIGGSGTVVLTGNNTGFIGTTTVASGILDVQVPGAFPGSIDPGGVESGATLAIGVSGLDPSVASSEIATLSSSGDLRRMRIWASTLEAEPSNTTTPTTPRSPTPERILL